MHDEDSEGQVKSEFKISMGAGAPLASVSYSGTPAQASAQDAAPQEPAPATKKDPGPLRRASKTEKMQALLDEAIQRAEGFDGVYTIVNDYDFVLKPEDLSAFLRKKGYSIGQYSTKNIMLVGNIAGVGGMVDELDFYKPDCLRKYAYYVLRGQDQEDKHDILPGKHSRSGNRKQHDQRYDHLQDKGDPSGDPHISVNFLSLCFLLVHPLSLR